MLSRMGLHKTLLVYSFINCTVLFIAFLLIKDRPRLHKQPVTDITWVDSTLFRNGVFWSMAIALGVTVL